MDESVASFGDEGTPDDAPESAPDNAPDADPSSALEHADDLPAGFRAGLSSVGDLEALERGSAP